MAAVTGDPEGPRLFSKQDGDIILRSTNGVDFRVHKAALSDASPVFASMFTLPQPAAPATPSKSTSALASSSAESSPELPVVDMAESSEVLDRLLRLCYPSTDPDTSLPDLQLRDIARLIQTARKYDMQEVLARAARLFTTPGALDDLLHVLRVFAVASDVDVPQAEEAARASLRAPLGKDLPYELDGISPASLYRLLEFRRRAHAEAVVYLTDAAEWTRTTGDYYAWACDTSVGDAGELTVPIARFQCGRHSESEYGVASFDEDDRPQLQINQPYVIQALVEQAELEADGVFGLQLPGALYQDTYDYLDSCEDCEGEARMFLHAVSEHLQRGVREVMLQVPLDEPDT